MANSRSEEKMRSKHGFTLIELTIVIAVTAIVVTMACGFMITYNQRSKEIQKTGDTVVATSELKKVVNSWLSESDNGDITVEAGGLKNSAGYTLKFDSVSKKLKWHAFEDKEIYFEDIAKCTFSQKPSVKGIVYCNIESNGKTVDILFDTFNSDNVRERYWQPE